MKKYKLTDDWRNAPNGEKVYRIEALIDFTLINGKEVKIGDKGGWLNSEDRLSHEGLCWIYDDCTMYEQSYRSENSIGFGYSRQYGNSCQYGNSQQYSYSRQYGNSRQYGYSHQYGNSCQYGNSQQYSNSRQYDSSHQYGYSRQYGNSQQYGNSRQYGNSYQYGNSRQYGNSQQYGNSRQYGNSCQYGNSQQGSNCIDTGNGDVIHLISPTSKREITIAISDRSVATGCFSGSSHWLVSPLRGIKVPEWARWLAEKLNAETDAFLRENLKKEFEEKFL